MASEIEGHTRGYQLQQLHKDATVPKGAIYVSQWEMTKLLNREIDRWSPRYEMWPFSYGLGIIGSAAALTGVMCFSHYKRAFNLGHKVSRLALLTSLGLPCATAILTHQALVTEKILAYRYQCPLCLESRAAGLQLASGGVFPLILTLISSAAAAKTYLTAAVPPLTAVRQWTQLVFQLSKPIKANFLLMCVINIGVVQFVTYCEQNVADKVLQRVMANPTSPHAANSRA